MAILTSFSGMMLRGMIIFSATWGQPTYLSAAAIKAPRILFLARCSSRLFH